MSTTSNRTLFACAWCGAEQILLDLDARAVAAAAEAWHNEHDAHNLHHDEPRCCDDCGAVSPVQAVDVPRVIGLQTFDQQAHMDWLDDHDCAERQSDELKAWRARCDEVNDYYSDPLEQLIGARPSWAEPCYDHRGNLRTEFRYQSEPDVVAISRYRGRRDGNGFASAFVEISAAVNCRGPMAILSNVFFDDDGERHSGRLRLTSSEARQIADALHAAAALAESEPIGGAG